MRARVISVMKFVNDGEVDNKIVYHSCLAGEVMSRCKKNVFRYNSRPMPILENNPNVLAHLAVLTVYCLRRTAFSP